MPDITDKDLELFNKYKELGSPEDISTSLGEHQTMVRNKAIAEVSEIAGFKPSVLEKLGKDVEFFVKDKEAFVKHEGKDVKLVDYANDNWKEFLPSLKAESETRTTGIVRPFVKQSAEQRETTSKSVGSKLANSYILQQYGSVLKPETV